MLKALCDFAWNTGCALEVEFCTRDIAACRLCARSTGGKDHFCVKSHIPVLIDDSYDNVQGARKCGVKTYLVGTGAFFNLRHADELILDATNNRAQFLDLFLTQPAVASDRERLHHLRRGQSKIIKCYDCQGNHKVSACPQQRRRW